MVNAYFQNEGAFDFMEVRSEIENELMEHMEEEQKWEREVNFFIEDVVGFAGKEIDE